MSNPATLNSIINKLLGLPNTYLTLKFNGPNVEKKVAEIKERISDTTIDSFNYIALGSFLQYVNLSIFTDSELRFLLRLNYSFIENNSVVGSLRPFNIFTPMYDNGGTLYNVDDSRSEVEDTFNKLHSLNKNLSIAYFVSFITTQI